MLMLLTFLFYPSDDSIENKNENDIKVEVESNFDSFFAEHLSFKLLNDDSIDYIIYPKGIELQLNLEGSIKYTFDYHIKNEELNIILNPVNFITKNNDKKDTINSMGNVIDNFHIHEKFKTIKFDLNPMKDLYISAMYENKLQTNNLLSTKVKFNNQAHIYTFNEKTDNCNKNKLPNLILKDKSIAYNSKIDSDSDYCDSAKIYYFLTTNKFGYKFNRYTVV
jgi:hypothetical protein